MKKLALNPIKAHPSLKILQEFTRRYFRYSGIYCPKVRYKKMTDLSGRFGSLNRVIFLNPKIPKIDRLIPICLGYYTPKLIRFMEGEQYFKCLLLEIGHFKFRVNFSKKISKELKGLLLKSMKGVYEINEFRTKPMKFIEKEKLLVVVAMHYYMRDYTRGKRKKGEYNQNYIDRCWKELTRRYKFNEHIAIEDWARKEFFRQRKVIRSLLRKTINKGD